MPAQPDRRRAFTALAPIPGQWLWRIKLVDIIVVVLGTGGILLMAGYAALCDRI